LRRTAWERFRTVIIPGQVQPDGSCPLEEARTQSLSYSSMNLDAFAITCALSEQEQSGQSNQAFAAPVSSAVLGPGIVVPPAQPRLVVTDAWRTGTPVPSPPVSKHVLISVFLL
jgi:hypothetical protein